LPLNVELSLTTERERRRLRGRKVIASDDPDWAVKAALVLLQGGSFNRLVMGVDPGPRPGIAILGDGKVLLGETLLSPEEVAPAIRDFLSLVSTNELLLRVGHGDPTNRDRIINALWDVTRNIEVVDETSTTGRTGHPDAALVIATPAASCCHPVPRWPPPRRGQGHPEAEPDREPGSDNHQFLAGPPGGGGNADAERGHRKTEEERGFRGRPLRRPAPWPGSFPVS
jgi:hypothetical protein